MLAGVTSRSPPPPRRRSARSRASIGNAISRTSHNFNSAGEIAVVNFPGGARRGSAEADIIGPNGARAQVFGGSGVTYYWPSGGLRIDSNIEMAGGGLPNGPGEPSPARAGAPMSGVADLAPYSVKGSGWRDSNPLRARAGRIDRAQHRRAARRAVSRTAGCRRCVYRSPASIGRGGSFAFGTSCAVVSFNYLQMSSLQLGPTRLPVCPIGPAIIVKRAGGPVLGQRALQQAGAERPPRQSPLHLLRRAGRSSARVRLQQLGDAARPGHVADPVRRLAAQRDFVGADIRGNLAGARRRSATCRCCSATARASGCSMTAISASTAR